MIHLVHGFNVKDGGEETIATLSPFLRNDGHDVKVFSYGWLGLMGVWFLNPRVVSQLVPKVRPGDVGIGHSNGCSIIHMAALHGAPFKRVIYINPTLNSNVPVAPGIERTVVYHSPSDDVVKFASLLRELVPWAPIGDPVWGDMGSRGYQPGRYSDGEFVPKGLTANAIHIFNMVCDRSSIVRFLVRLIVAPIGIFYWLCLGPFEVGLTFYFNNIRGSDPEMKLQLSRAEDRRFIGYALILPVSLWGAISIIYAVAI